MEVSAGWGSGDRNGASGVTFIAAFHVGILVADLAAALPRLGTALGVEFRAPAELPFVHRVTDQDPNAHSGVSRVSFSRQGPPYIEVLEADESRYKGLHQGERIHHIGLWVPNAEAELGRLTEVGIESDVELRSDNGERVLAWLNHPGSLHGVRIEYVDETLRPTFEAWIGGEGEPDFWETD